MPIPRIGNLSGFAPQTDPIFIRGSEDLLRGIQLGASGVIQGLEQEAQARIRRKEEKKAKKEAKKERTKAIAIGVGGAALGAGLGALAAPVAAGAGAAGGAAGGAASSAVPASTAIGALTPTAAGSAASLAPAAASAIPASTLATLPAVGAGTTAVAPGIGIGTGTGTGIGAGVGSGVAGALPPALASAPSPAPTPSPVGGPTIQNAQAQQAANPLSFLPPPPQTPSAGRRFLTGAGLGAASALTGANLTGPYLSNLYSLPGQQRQHAMDRFRIGQGLERTNLARGHLDLAQENARALASHREAMLNRPTDFQRNLQLVPEGQRGAAIGQHFGTAVSPDTLARQEGATNRAKIREANTTIRAAGEGIQDTLSDIGSFVSNRFFPEPTTAVQTFNQFADIGGLDPSQRATAAAGKVGLDVGGATTSTPSRQQNWEFITQQLNLQPDTPEYKQTFERYWGLDDRGAATHPGDKLSPTVKDVSDRMGSAIEAAPNLNTGNFNAIAIAADALEKGIINEREYDFLLAQMPGAPRTPPLITGADQQLVKP